MLDHPALKVSLAPIAREHLEEPVEDDSLRLTVLGKVRLQSCEKVLHANLNVLQCLSVESLFE